MSLENVHFDISGSKAGELHDSLRAASGIFTATKADLPQPADILAAANADYARILGALYAKGYYGGTVSIKADGREVADISPLSVPVAISSIIIAIRTGPAFQFGRLRIAPTYPGTVLPEGFETGAPAKAGLLRAAVAASTTTWRENGHAKVEIARQSVVADHGAHSLSADVTISPGPLVHFGQLRQKKTSTVRPDAVTRIAGMSDGEVFTPGDVAQVAERLRRTGAFRSVSVREAKQLGSENTLDIELTLVDEKPRRLGFGGELSSLEGLTLSGFWLHRNLLGGAERLRIDGEVANIAGQTGGIDYSLGARLERPAVFGPDTSAFVTFGLERLDEPDFVSDQAHVGIGATRIVSDNLEIQQMAELRFSYVEDGLGSRDFTLLAFPGQASLDRRDDRLDAKGGSFLHAEITPYLGLVGTTSGLRTLLEARAYRSFGQEQRMTFATRARIGGVFGPGTAQTPPDYLFYSGGGGTVRGQPYQSLDVDLGGGVQSGGRSFIGLSGELRGAVSRKISLVGFADAGYIGPESFYDGSGNWHSGAGIGLRYATPVGPIRLDVATPLSGNTGDGIQIYVGIGQAF